MSLVRKVRPRKRKEFGIPGARMWNGAPAIGIPCSSCCTHRRLSFAVFLLGSAIFYTLLYTRHYSRAYRACRTIRGRNSDTGVAQTGEKFRFNRVDEFQQNNPAE